MFVLGSVQSAHLLPRPQVPLPRPDLPPGPWAQPRRLGGDPPRRRCPVRGVGPRQRPAPTDLVVEGHDYATSVKLDLTITPGIAGANTSGGRRPGENPALNH